MTSRNAKGFSLFELLIAVAVVGIISALAVPAYRSYIETANMTKVTANFEQGVRVGQLTFSKAKTRASMGITGTLPATVDDWVTLLNKSGVKAPGGGPAYIASTNNATSGRGDPVTGAIGVRWTPESPEIVKKNGNITPAKIARLELWRPLYLSLVEQRAIIEQESIDIRIQRKP